MCMQQQQQFPSPIPPPPPLRAAVQCNTQMKYLSKLLRLVYNCC